MSESKLKTGRDNKPSRQRNVPAMGPRNDNAIWFLAALVGGGALIGLIKIVAPASNWVPACVAAGVVIALTYYYWGNDVDAREEEGDNVYYLGLLFTLISLVIALLQFLPDSSGSDSQARILELVENFGIALTSTIFGIACRVFLQNFQKEKKSDSLFVSPKDQNKRKQERGREPSPKIWISPTPSPLPPQPGENARPEEYDQFHRTVLSRIARELETGATALARFNRHVQSYASETAEFLIDHREKLKDESAEITNLLKGNIEQYTEDLSQRTDRTLQKLEQAYEVTAKKVDQFINLIESNIDQHTRDLSQHTARSLQETEKIFTATAAKVDQTIQHVQTTNDEFIKQTKDSARTTHEEMQASRNRSLDIITSSFNAVAEKAGELLEQLDSTHKNFINELRSGNRSFLEETQALSKTSLETLKQNVNSIAIHSNTLSDKISTANEKIGSTLDTFGSELVRSSQAGSRFSGNVDQATNAAGELSSEIAKLRETIRPIHDSAPSISALLNTVRDIEDRLRTGKDLEQIAISMKDIVESLEKTSNAVETATRQAQDTNQSFVDMGEHVSSTGEHVQKAKKALGDLAIVAEENIEKLQKSTKRGWWNKR